MVIDGDANGDQISSDSVYRRKVLVPKSVKRRAADKSRINGSLPAKASSGPGDPARLYMRIVTTNSARTSVRVQWIKKSHMWPFSYQE